MRAYRNSWKTNPFRNVVKTLAALFFIYVGVALLFEPVALFHRYRHYVVVTDSMEPTIMRGDLVFVRNATLEQLEVGDIVAFRVDLDLDGTDDVVIHYVAMVDREESMFRTRPEGTETLDPWEIPEENIVGVYSSRIPRIGRFMLFAQSAIGRTIIIIDVIVLYALYRLIWVSSREKKREAATETSSEEDGTKGGNGHVL